MVTVKEIMSPGIISNSRVIAGTGGLHSPILYVDILESAEGYHWLHQNTFLITNLAPICDNEAEQRLLMGRLRDKKVAAVAIKPKRFVDEIPPFMVKEAELYGIPLIELSYDVVYSELISKIHHLIIKDNTELLEQSLRVNKMFSNLAINGGNTYEVAQMLSHNLQQPVLICDANFKSVNFACDDGDMKRFGPYLNHINRCLQNYLGGDRPDPANPILHWFDQELACGFSTMRIIYAGECCGYITAVETQKHGALADMALENAATFAALTIATTNSTKEKETMILRGIFSDLLFRKSYTQENVSHWLNYFKWEIDNQYAVVIVHGEEAEAARSASDQLIQNALLSFGQRIRDQLPQAFYIMQQDDLILIHSVENAASGQEQHYPGKLRAIYTQMLAGFKQIFPSLWLAACFGNAVPALDKISGSYQQAQIALGIAKKISDSRENGCFFYDKLDIYHIFTEYADKEELQGLVKKYLGPLLDVKHTKFDALKTLEAYIRCGCSITEGAQQLFIHANTMKYRMAKIRETLNNPLDDPQYIYVLSTALLINRLL